MKKYIRRIIVWALGFEPFQSEEWTVYIEGEHEMSKLLPKDSMFPPKIIRRPKVIAETINEDSFPKIQELETFVPNAYDFDRRFVVYRRVLQ